MQQVAAVRLQHHLPYGAPPCSGSSDLSPKASASVCVMRCVHRAAHAGALSSCFVTVLKDVACTCSRLLICVEIHSDLIQQGTFGGRSHAGIHGSWSNTFFGPPGEFRPTAYSIKRGVSVGGRPKYDN